MDLDVHLGGIIAGDPDAFARWVAGAEPRVRRSLASFAARVDVEAVVQETLLRVWQVAPRHRPDGQPDSLLRLAIRIGRNLAIDDVRRTRPDLLAATVPNVVDEPAVAPAVPDPMLRRILAGCRELLRGKPAQAFTARLESAGGEPDETLATRLGMRPNTFLQNVTRARRLLAACLEKHGVRVEEHRA